MNTIEESDIGNLSEELKGLQSDKLKNNIIINSYKESLANDLKNGNLGKDMIDTINKKKIIKISMAKQLKYKLNKFIDKVDTETSKDILNPVKKGIMKQYKDDDIDKLSLYSKELAEDNIKKDLEIKTLTQ